LCGPQNRSGRCGEFLSPAGNGTPAIQPVATSTVPPRLSNSEQSSMNLMCIFSKRGDHCSLHYSVHTMNYRMSISVLILAASNFLRGHNRMLIKAVFRSLQLLLLSTPVKCALCTVYYLVCHFSPQSRADACCGPLLRAETASRPPCSRAVMENVITASSAVCEMKVATRVIIFAILATDPTVLLPASLMS
jgi:hypothetical protein